MRNHTRPSTDDISFAIRREPARWPRLAAMGVGIIAALLSVSISHSWFSNLGDAAAILIVVLFPGILGSVVIAQNAHAFSRWVAAGINGIIYFLIALIVFRAVSRRILRNSS
jgi:hypothetical protein